MLLYHSSESTAAVWSCPYDPFLLFVLLDIWEISPGDDVGVGMPDKIVWLARRFDFTSLLRLPASSKSLVAASFCAKALGEGWQPSQDVKPPQTTLLTGISV